MDSQDVSLFRLSKEGQLGDILAPFEFVISITNRATTLFALTSNGRILTLDKEFKVTGEAKLPPQKKQTSDYARIYYVDISGLLLVLFSNTLYFFQIEEKTAELLYSKSDVLRFDLSTAGTQQSFPDHDLIIVTTRNQAVRIILSIGEQCRERVVWKWRADSLVSAVSYEGLAVCLTTQTGCYVYSIESQSPDPILAFPVDRTVLPLNAAPPSICPVDDDSFVVAGCLSDMALFVDRTGSAARPPLIWNQEYPTSVVKTDTSLLVIGATKLMVFDYSSAGRMRQEVQLPSHPCASGLLGDCAVIFTRAADADVYCVRQLSWAQKANELLEKGDIESAIYLVCNNTVKSDEDLIVNAHFAAVFDKDEKPEDNISVAMFVERLVSCVLDEEWSLDQAKDWATLLTIVRVRLCESPVELINVLETTEQYDKQSVTEYADGRKLVNAQLVLRVLNGSLAEALSMEWLDPALLPLVDPLLVATLMQRTTQSDVDVIVKWRYFIREDAEAEQLLLDLVKTRSTWFDEEFVLDLFNGSEDEFEVILGLHNSAAPCSSQLTTRLLKLIIARLSPSIAEATHEESARLRKLLIDIILAGYTDIACDLDGDHLTVERVVAANRTDPEKAIQGVIESVEFPGALQAIQQIIHHFSSSNASLSTHFLQQLKNKCELDPSAAASLRLPDVIMTVIEASPSLICSGAINFIPDNSSLETFAPLFCRELLAVNDGTVASRLGRAFGERAMMTGKQNPMPLKSFKITDTTRCGVCSDRIDPASAMHFLPSGNLVHSSCQPHFNLCPVTNRVFRG